MSDDAHNRNSSVRTAEIMMIRLLALEVERTAESMALAARELTSRRVSKGQLVRTLHHIQQQMNHLAPLMSSLAEQAQERSHASRVDPSGERAAHQSERPGDIDHDA